MRKPIKLLLVSSIVMFATTGCNLNSMTQEDIPTDPYNAEKIPSDIKNKYLNEINKVRATARYCGNVYKKAVPPLKWNDKLYKAAYEHTNDMVRNNIFSHQGSGTATDKTGADLNKKSEQEERISHNGYKYRYVGENITAGTELNSAHKAVQNLVDSPLHCENLMDSDFKEVGMAYIKKSGTHYTNYWTQDFGNPR